MLRSRRRGRGRVLRYNVLGTISVRRPFRPVLACSHATASLFSPASPGKRRLPAVRRRFPAGTDMLPCAHFLYAR
ncbi:MAG: hypothetical protein GXO24_05295 [Chlorobi bacterium]|nr:hypothetical protein [Chlorobiota bacterium]